MTAAKALDMPRDVVYRILLFVNTTVGHSVERVHALATLYDEMTAQAAEHMVAIWQALHKARARRKSHIVRCTGTTKRARGRAPRRQLCARAPVDATAQ